jgi:sulfide:quinone oxidoreductase
VQGASNFAAAYEYTMIIDGDLRRRGLREQIPMTFVSSEPCIGHLGIGCIGETKRLLESEFREHHIQWIINAKVDRIEQHLMHVTEMSVTGEEKQKHELPFRHCMMMPAYRGVDAVRDVKGLVNERGFILVDKCQRNPNFRNVYAVGVCVDVPVKEQTPVPVGAQKNGYMIESMVRTTAHNIRAQLDGREPLEEACVEFYPKEVASQVYAGAGHFDKKWLNPVSGLYAFALWNQLTVEQSQ